MIKGREGSESTEDTINRLYSALIDSSEGEPSIEARPEVKLLLLMTLRLYRGNNEKKNKEMADKARMIIEFMTKEFMPKDSTEPRYIKSEVSDEE